MAEAATSTAIFTGFPQLRVDVCANDILGKGAYGVVYKVKFLNYDYAMKVVHTAPFFGVDAEALERFKQECQFMNDLKHPNLVLSFGTVSMGYPMLIMERLDCNLNNFLEARRNEMGVVEEFVIAEDIICGIEFLHRNGVVHRDLSGANILMVGTRAKISDLGMAKLISKFQLNQLTPCPGNIVYMPSTVFQNPPKYDEKIDIFSFGVLLVQILTKEYPCPTSAIVEVNGQRVCPSEIERRIDHIKVISNDRLLREIALRCLKENLEETPSATDVAKSMETIKKYEPFNSMFMQNAQMVTVHQQHTIEQLIREHPTLQVVNRQKEEVIQQLFERVKLLELDQKSMQGKYQNQLEKFGSELQQRASMEIASVRGEAEMVIDELKRRYEGEAIKKVEEEKSHYLHTLDQTRKEVQVLQDEKAEFEKKAVEKEQESLQLQYEISQLSISRSSTNPELSFDDDISPACTKLLHRDSAAVVNNEAIFLRPARTREILTYSKGHWARLFSSKVDNCALAFCSGRLTTIGGRSIGATGEVVGDLYCRNEAGEWQKDLPAMSVPKELAQAVTSGKTLIVVGGRNKSILDVVEIFNEDFMQWHTACKLPCALYFVSVATFDESLIIVGGKGKEKESLCIRCKLTDLCMHSYNDSSSKKSIWETIEFEIPPKSTLVKFKSQLFSVGGVTTKDGRTVASSTVCSYSPDTFTWTEVAMLKTPRYHCFTAVLSEELYIIGGDLGSNILTNSVEVGTFE